MPAPAPTDRRDQALIDQAIDGAIMLGLAVLILVGFATSYRTLRDLAAGPGGYPAWLAPAVPLSFDLGIVVLSLKVARAAREGRTAPVMRLLVAALSASTIVANAAAADSATARLLHAVPPAMFVICFESVAITARRRALDSRGLLPGPLPRLRAARWLLAPRSTWKSWRAFVLAPSVNSPAALPGDPLPPVDALTKTAVATRSRRGPKAREAADRDAIAIGLLRRHPTLTAPELCARLADHGHHVSVRTAQRHRARALSAAPAADSSAAALTTRDDGMAPA